MSIARTFALHGKEWSLVLEQEGTGAPIWRHLGAKVEPRELPPLADLRAPATFSLEEPPLPSVLPVAGLGNFVQPALELRGHDGKAIAVCFDDCSVECDDEKLVCQLHDTVSSISVTLQFKRKTGDGLEVSATLTNGASHAVGIMRIVSASIPLPTDATRTVSWRGRHNAEFVECDEPMPEHGWMRETRRGLTGHGGPCGCYVLSQDAGWHWGPVTAMQLAWSGDSRLGIERDEDGRWTCQAEAIFAPGELMLEPGESFTAPPLLLAIGDRGRNGAMAAMHALVRDRIAWPDDDMTPRPVHLNSWEACYFAHDEQRTIRLAEQAAKIGIERFVLDDGWFEGRNSDRAGLGDWTPDPQKYPNGLAPVAKRVNQLGMQFGLWVEPEMVNSDSDLYRAHPDWVLALPDRARPTARNQLVLDMRRDKVRDHLFERLDALISEAPIAYLKWDHNRNHAPGGGAAQTRGTYDLMERLRAAHPEVEIESCAGGGGRIDAGIAAHTHRFWTSDNIDALARVPMQRGFLAFMPPEVMGAHIGASPSHATGRVQSLDFRAAIACQGHLGIELDPETLSAEESTQLASWIDFYKRWRSLVHAGRVFLGETKDGQVWQAQGNDDELLLWLIRCDHPRNRHAQPVRLPFAKGRDWEVTLLRSAIGHGMLTPRLATVFETTRDQPQSFTGSWLSHAGLPVPDLPAQSAIILHLKAVA